MSAYFPFIVIGIFTGSIYGLAAMGLVLTYKTTGVFNFAYGAVAMICAFVYWQMHDAWHWSAWIALPLLLLVVAPLVGYIFEALFRPLAGLSAEVPIVVSIAMIALFTAIVVIVWNGGQARGLQPVIPRSSFHLAGHLFVGYDQLGTFVIACLAGGALWWLLRHTRFGTATRAVVDNRDLASIIGINGDNVRRTSWILSTVFGGLVGVLLSPDLVLDTNQLFLVVLGAFAPAVIARLTSLPWAFGSALVIGVIQSIPHKWSSSGLTANIESTAPFIILFITLIVLGNQLKESGMAVRSVSASQASDGLEADEVAHAERARRSTLIGVALFVFCIFLPNIVAGPKVGILTVGIIFAIVGVTLVVLTGWAGQISLAQFSFVGVGAYIVGHLAGHNGSNFLGAALLGMAVAVPLGIIVGLPSLRLKGLYLALATLAFALIMDGVVFNDVRISGGISGIIAPRPRIFGVSFASTTAMYELCLGVLGAVLLAALLLRRGPIGRRLLILRDSPLAAQMLGVNLTITKLGAFVASGVIAALAGALFGSAEQALNPMNFQFSVSLTAVLLVVLGGRSVLSGAIIGAVTYMVGYLGLLPIPTAAHNYIQLGVALGVIGLGRNPEGTFAISQAEARRSMSILKPRPRRARVAALDVRVRSHGPAMEAHSGV
ncbi:MAG TPA: ABC transporter permease [Acidimicrobiales bacterium]|nr:ABC transporter permease [Acidimicrobiales bacterium]